MHVSVTLVEAVVPPTPSEEMLSPSGWLDPSGRFYRLRTFGDHTQWARAAGSTREDLQRAGWLRVTYLGTGQERMVYVQNPFRAPSSVQRRVLRDAAIEGSWGSIVYDNDDHDRVLWSSGTAPQS